MSDENTGTEIEEPKDEVEGHGNRMGQSDEPATDTDDEVEAHGKLDGRMDGRTDGRLDGRVD